MKAFSAKTLLSIVATSIIVSGLAYAATISSVVTQTINSGDTMSAAWFNDVNTRLLSIPTPSAQKGDPLYVKQANFASRQAYYDAIYTQWINSGWSVTKATEVATMCSSNEHQGDPECLTYACDGIGNGGTVLAQRNNGCLDNIYGNDADPEGTTKCAGQPWIGMSCLTR